MCAVQSLKTFSMISIKKQLWSETEMKVCETHTLGKD